MLNKIVWYFSFQKQLTTFATKVVPNKLFEQSLYLDLLLKDMVNQDKKPQLLQQTNFFLIKGQFFSLPEMELREHIKGIKYTEVHKILAEALEKQFEHQLDNLHFMNLLPIARSLKLQIDYMELIRRQIGLHRKLQQELKLVSPQVICKFAIECKKIYNDAQNLDEQVDVQRLINQAVMAQIKRLSLNNIFTILINTQNVQVRKLAGLKEYKDLAYSTANAIFNKIFEEKNNTKQSASVLSHPQFYTAAVQYLIMNHAMSTKNAQILENIFTERSEFNEKAFKLHCILLHGLTKACKGELVLDRILKMYNQEVKILPVHMCQILLCLLQQHISIESNKYPKITAEVIQQIKKTPLKCQPLLDTLIQELKQLDLDALPENSQNQIIQSIDILNALGQSANLKILKQGPQKPDLQRNFNEINYEVEAYLNENKIEYVKESPFLNHSQDYFLPQLNTVVECDGAYHYIPDINQPIASCISRNFVFMSHGKRIIQVNWFKQLVARANKDPQTYLKHLFSQLNNDIMLIN